MDVEGKKILVFGGTGSLGQALVRRLAKANSLTLFSRDEAKHWTLRNSYEGLYQVDFALGDIRDKQRVFSVIQDLRPHIIILAAALKQVDTCERTPDESIKTNILGVNNVIESTLTLKAEISNLETVLLISTDKACAPTNVYGMCKAISERTVTSASLLSEKIRFMAVRYGNVLESRGSIIPLFQHQGESGKSITLTHRDMTRFIMTIDESIDLIQSTIQNGESGQVWLPKLKAMRIIDLAEIFAEKYATKVIETGIRPGEKIHEYLISEPESLRVVNDDLYYKLQPSFRDIQGAQSTFSYSSQSGVLSRTDLKLYLEKLNILEKNINEFVGKKIEEIRTN